MRATMGSHESADGVGSLAIRVLAVNERARRFYVSLGGVFAGDASNGEVFYSWPDIGALRR